MFQGPEDATSRNLVIILRLPYKFWPINQCPSVHFSSNPLGIELLLRSKKEKSVFSNVTAPFYH